MIKKLLVLFLFSFTFVACLMNEDSEINSNIDYEKMRIIDIDKEGNYIYVLDFYDGLVVEDISSLESVRIIKRYNDIRGNKIIVEDNFIYIVDDEIINIYNKENNEKIYLIDRIDLKSDITDIKIYDNKIYSISYDNPGTIIMPFGGYVKIIDISEEGKLSLKKSFNTEDLSFENQGWFLGLDVNESGVYIAGSLGKVLKFDLEGNYLERLKGEYFDAETKYEDFRRISIEREVMYLGGENRILAVNISDFNNSSILFDKEISQKNSNLLLDDNYLYYDDEDQIEIFSKFDFTEMNKIEGDYKFLVESPHIYIIDGILGVRILDISNIGDIQEIENILN